jgi:hypothetical protein
MDDMKKQVTVQDAERKHACRMASFGQTVTPRTPPPAYRNEGGKHIEQSLRERPKAKQATYLPAWPGPKY